MTAQPIHPDDLAEQRRTIRTLHVQHRPAPGLAAPQEPAEPAPAPAVDTAPLLAQARAALAGAVVVEELPAGPTGEWEAFRRAIGPCCVCGEPCRSLDPEGRKRHWCCEVPA